MTATTHSDVIPAQAGIQGPQALVFVVLGPRLRGDDAGALC
jgi:hypothetical protein